jgi:hypothetical protein
MLFFLLCVDVLKVEMMMVDKYSAKWRFKTTAPGQDSFALLE